MTNLAFTFDTNRHIPLYRQLYEFIKTEIREGRLQPDQKLPSKRRLAGHLGISLNTVETTYEQLIAEGYIYSIPQSGCYVCKVDEFMPLAESPQDNRGAPIQPIFQQNTKLAMTSQCRYDLSTNQVDTSYFPYKTWARTIRAIMQENSEDLLRLTHAQGDQQLRESMAEYLHAFRGVNCQPEQIIIGAGTEYLITLISQIMGRDRLFAVENPGYRKTAQVLQSNGVSVRHISLDHDGIDIGKLSDSKADVVYVTPSHHFPLGIIMPVSRRMQLLRWASQSDRRFIIEDDYDSEFRYVGRPIPALQGLDRHDRVIYLGTFSKSLAPSIRISYMVLPPHLLDIYKRTLGFYSSTVSRFEQAVLHRFIKDGVFEKHLNRMRIVYRERKDCLADCIAQSKHRQKLKIIGENAGLHLLLQVKNGLTETELITRAANAGVRIHGLSDYYAENAGISNEEKESGTVIIGYSNHEPREIQTFMAILLDAWFT